MPLQLIYTSAPRGVVAGRSGYCTVARSAKMGEPLMLRLEQFSYYQHLSLSGGQERPIHCCRIVDIRGLRYHVLSRIQAAELDFTGRTNFLAHHLVFMPEEVRQFPSPPVILHKWSGWAKSWPKEKEPQLLETKDRSGFPELSGSAFVGATTWQQVTGDAVNGYSLLGLRAGSAFRVDNLSEEQILALFAESLELLELRDPRRDFHATAWQYTFTTAMQEQDNPVDFRWRCLHSDNPASTRFTGPECRPLSDLRALGVTSEETMLARSGLQAPTRVELRLDKSSITEGESIRIEATADGTPTPSFCWFEVEQGKLIELAGRSGATLQEQPKGRAKRYAVRARNRAGHKDSAVIEISISQPLRLASHQPSLSQSAMPGRRLGSGSTPEQTEQRRQALLSTPPGCKRKIEGFRDTFLGHCLAWHNPTSRELETINNNLNDCATEMQEEFGQIPQDSRTVIDDCRTSLGSLRKRNSWLHWSAKSLQLLALLASLAVIWVFFVHKQSAKSEASKAVSPSSERVTNSSTSKRKDTRRISTIQPEGTDWATNSSSAPPPRTASDTRPQTAVMSTPPTPTNQPLSQPPTGEQKVQAKKPPDSAIETNTHAGKVMQQDTTNAPAPVPRPGSTPPSRK